MATQLVPTSDPLVYSAPNIHYLLDSPTEFSDFTLKSVTIDDGVNGPPSMPLEENFTTGLTAMPVQSP